MLNFLVLVMLGGGFGALVRAWLMLGFEKESLHFPMDIFMANLSACLILGSVNALADYKKINASVMVLLGTGMMGGLSTFSSFILGLVGFIKTEQLWLGTTYLFSSLILGFVCIALGYELGRCLTFLNTNDAD